MTKRIDHRAYDAARRTLKTAPPRKARLPDGTEVEVYRKTTAVPGYFADGLTEIYEVTTVGRPIVIPGLGRATSRDELGWGRTRAEALAAAQARMTRRRATYRKGDARDEEER